MNIYGAIPEKKISYPVWILEYLIRAYPDIYEDLIYRRTPLWLKPDLPEDYFSDSLIQKLFLWACPEFIQSSLDFIMQVHKVYREEIPVLGTSLLFNSVSFHYLVFFEIFRAKKLLWIYEQFNFLNRF